MSTAAYARPRKAAPRNTSLRLEQLEERTVLATGIGVYVPSNDVFALRNSVSAGPSDIAFQMPAPGAVPVIGDWNGDGKDDFGIFDPASATWSLRYGNDSGPANAGVFKFGHVNGVPVVGDWNGDGRDDIGTYNRANAQWTLRFGASPGAANAGTFIFGDRNAQPVVGDWNGDGTDGIGTFNKSNGTWTLRQTASTGVIDAGRFRFGARNTIAVVGDWNNDGRDGIGTYLPSNGGWSLRQTASAGRVEGTFRFGNRSVLPVIGNWTGPPAPANALTTLVLPPVDLDLLGLEINTSPITIHLSTEQGNGKLLGNLLTTVSTLVDLDSAGSAINTVLDSTVDLLNSTDLSISAGSGPLDSAPAGAQQVLELFVAPVHLDLLGLQVDTSPIRVTITATSGQGLLLGNAVTTLINLFNPPLPEQLDLAFLNGKLDELLDQLNAQFPGIAPAPVAPVPISDGQILNVTVPPLDLNLLGLVLETSPIVVNASAATGNGLLVGNVLTTALKTLDANPQELSNLNTNINGILAQVVGILNASSLTLSSAAIGALPPLLQQLASPVLTAPAAGSTAPILDLIIASPNGTSPPVEVDLLGLTITTSNIEAHLSAVTGDGQVLGNLLYNLANLADPGGPGSLLNLFNLLGAGALNSTVSVVNGAVSPAASAPEELLTLVLEPLDIDLLGLSVTTPDPITVTLAMQGGDGKLLGNLLTGITTLINVDGVEAALNNVLETTVNLVNSVDLVVGGVANTGPFGSDSTPETLPVLELFVAPVQLDLLGLVATTSPIRLHVTATSGDGLILGNVLTELAHTFDPDAAGNLPDRLDINEVNRRLEDLIDRLAQHLTGIPTAPLPPVSLDPGQFLELTVPAIDLDLLGLIVETTPITLNAYANQGNGLLLGNILTTVLNTVDATPENLTGLNNNLNALLAQIVGVLNVADLIVSPQLIDSLPPVVKTLLNPLLISSTPGARTEILELIVASTNPSAPPVDADLLGLRVTTSNIEARLFAETGNNQILGNLLFNTANLLNPGNSLTLLHLLTQLGQLV